MSIINWIAIVLSVVLWMYQLNIGVGIAMSSSNPVKESRREARYYDRAERIRGVAFLGAILTFITQLIDNSTVKTIGLIILALTIIAIPLLWSYTMRAYEREADE